MRMGKIQVQKTEKPVVFQQEKIVFLPSLFNNLVMDSSNGTIYFVHAFQIVLRKAYCFYNC